MKYHALANHGAYECGTTNKLLVPVFLLQLQDKVKNTTNMESSLWCWFKVGVIPFSRNHETEADQIGLTLMAIAGYNPEEAIVSGLEWQF
jgi:predicted Zn-dependent protease